MTQRKDYTGKTFGGLTAIRFVAVRDGRTVWEFRCEGCGQRHEKLLANVVSYRPQSCGCSRHGIVWNPAKGHGVIKSGMLEEAVALRDQGYSMSLIAARMAGRYNNPKITKNAIIGALHRSGHASPKPLPRRPAAELIPNPIGTCMWPVGEPGQPDFRFCGEPQREGKPYCAEHCAVAYIKPKEAVAA